MDPRFFQTLVEPSRVAIVPVRTEVYTRVAASLASLTGTAVGSILISATATSTITPATHSPSIPSSSPSLQSLPPQFPAFHDTSTPPIALLTLTAAILCALILLLALSYFLLQRCTRGACPSCRACASEVEKWRRGELRRVTPDMVQRRMRAWDLEEGGGDRDEKTGGGEVGKEGGAEEYFLVDAKLQHPRPVYLWDVRRRDSGCHLVGRRWSAGSGETERSLQEAEEQAFTSLAGTTQDPRNRDSGLQRTGNEFEEVSVVREEKEQAPKSGIYQMPPPRQGNQSRFIERFSLATNYDL